MYVKKHIHTWNANASEMLLLFFNFFKKKLPTGYMVKVDFL